MTAWRPLDESLVFDGFRRIVRRTYELPDGTRADFDVKDEPDVVAVVPFTHDGDVVLVREYRPGPDELLLELPGGAVDPGEDAAEAAARELVEETGYAGDLRPVGRLLDCAYSTRERFAFVGHGCRRVAEPRPQAGEHPEVVLLSVPDFVRHVRSGRLTDAVAAYRVLDALGLLE